MVFSSLIGCKGKIPEYLTSFRQLRRRHQSLVSRRKRRWFIKIAVWWVAEVFLTISVEDYGSIRILLDYSRISGSGENLVSNITQ
ncbi:MAG TPA: hypothetical protein VJI75_04245 [Candidatus Nanoarchaeia archaeon]|nr:hypothetical protein [Candidatus Nanoarchaeia archaeon]